MGHMFVVDSWFCLSRVGCSRFVLCHHHHRLVGDWEFFFFFFLLVCLFVCLFVFFYYVLLSWLVLLRLETFHYVHGESIAVLRG